MKLSKQDLQKIKKILRQHDVNRADLFGSYARGDANKRSDIDILIEFNNNSKKTLFDLSGLKISLQDELKKKFDVVPFTSVNHLLKPYIMKDKKPLLK